MNDYGEMKMTTINNSEEETVKAILENTDTILFQIERHIEMIADCIYRGEAPDKCVDSSVANVTLQNPPMRVIIKSQRDRTENILEELVRIKDALW